MKEIYISQPPHSYDSPFLYQRKINSEPILRETNQVTEK